MMLKEGWLATKMTGLTYVVPVQGALLFVLIEENNSIQVKSKLKERAQFYMSFSIHLDQDLGSNRIRFLCFCSSRNCLWGAIESRNRWLLSFLVH